MELVLSLAVQVSLTLYGRITPDQPTPEASVMIVRDGFMRRNDWGDERSDRFLKGARAWINCWFTCTRVSLEYALVKRFCQVMILLTCILPSGIILCANILSRHLDILGFGMGSVEIFSR